MAEDAKKLARKKELEEKRKRLEEYRDKSKAAPEPAVAAAPAPAAPTPAAAALDLKKLSNVDDLLRTLDVVKAPDVPVPAGVSLFSGPSSSSSPAGGSSAGGNAAAASASPASSSPAPPSATEIMSRWSIQHKLAEISIAPQTPIYYSKGTQTASSSTEEAPAVTSAPPPVTSLRDVPAPSGSPAPAAVAGPPLPDVKELTAEEKNDLLKDPAISSGLQRASKTMERALYVASQYDIFVDYTVAEKSSQSVQRGNLVSAGTLYDARLCKNRTVADLQASPKYSELFVAAYSAPDGASTEPDGLVLVWSALNMLQRPEFVFHCQSPVMTAQFAKFNPTVVIGGTYSGQVVLWDTRAKSAPVARSPLTSAGHTHPIYSLSTVGTANASNLISVSTDGRLCSWVLENLAQPVEALDLLNAPQRAASAAAPVAATSHAFPEGEPNEVYVGSEEGAIFQAFRHGAKAGVCTRFDGHSGPVSALSFHPPKEGTDFGDLFLSCSLDWSAKLWSRRRPGVALRSFEANADYVYDARWSPVHPAVFALCDGKGLVDVWNLNQDSEQPLLRTTASTKALNRICWSGDGLRLLAGDTLGKIGVWEVPREAALPSGGDALLFENAVGQLLSSSSSSSSSSTPSSTSSAPSATSPQVTVAAPITVQ